MAITNSGFGRSSKLKAQSLKKAPGRKLPIEGQRNNAARELWRAAWGLCFWAWLLFWALSFALGTSCTRAADETARVTSIPALPKLLYEEARARYQKETNSVEAAWQFGRAAFDLADLATNDTQRAALAQEGIDACRHGVGLDPKSAPAHYYLGLNYGQLAQTKLLGALKLVDRMEESWKKTIELD